MIAPMCMKCDGASNDEFQFHLHGLIQSHGWAVIPVVADRVERSWAYTIGLAGHFEHPELVVVGLAPVPAGRLLNSIGGLVRDGVQLRAGEKIAGAGAKRMRLEKVHDHHFASGTFAAWVDYYGALGPPFPEPRAIEAVLSGRRPRLHGRDW